MRFLIALTLFLAITAVSAARVKPHLDLLSNQAGEPLPEYCIFEKAEAGGTKSVDLGRVPTSYLRLVERDTQAPYDWVINLCRVNQWAYKVFTPGCVRSGLIQEYVPQTQLCGHVFNANPEVVPPPYTFNADGSLTLQLLDGSVTANMTVQCGSSLSLYGHEFTHNADYTHYDFTFSTSAACLGTPPRPDPDNRAWPPMWPLPKSFTNGTGVVVLSPSLAVSGNVATNTDMVAALARFSDRTFPHAVNSTAQTSVVINVTHPSAVLEPGYNESYTLTVDASGSVSIEAVTLFGAYHALETLSQLTGFDFDANAYKVRHAPITIYDEPRFPHRGLLIDTARHFLPLRTIQRIIESMTYAKLNVLHWHLVDAQSFPFLDPTYPQLAEQGAWSNQERFTVNDVKGIVEYARQRGVRVMVEFDTPGHSASLCAAFPDICPQPPCKSSNINNWALDFTKNKTFEVVNTIWRDLGKLFPERLMHLGGDEVDYWCWQHHPAIQEWLAKRGWNDHDGYLYYIQRVQEYLWALPGNRDVVGWEEIWNHFGTKLNKKTIIQQWLPHSVSLPKNVTSHGYRLIWSDASRWYFDQLKVTWEEMYDAEPCTGLTAAECALILGGEGCQWGETVDTSDAMQTIWPRLAAVAERLWSPRDLAAHSRFAYDRMIGFRCLLNRRGIEAAPVNNLAARQAPDQPGSCYWQ